MAAAEQTLQLLVGRKSSENEACRIASQPQTQSTFIKVYGVKGQAVWSNTCFLFDLFFS